MDAPAHYRKKKIFFLHLCCRLALHKSLWNCASAADWVHILQARTQRGLAFAVLGKTMSRVPTKNRSCLYAVQRRVMPDLPFN